MSAEASPPRVIRRPFTSEVECLLLPAVAPGESGDGGCAAPTQAGSASQDATPTPTESGGQAAAPTRPGSLQAGAERAEASRSGLAPAPPLLVCLHGQGQSGARMARWVGAAVPAGWAAAFPDGFHGCEVRRTGRPARLGRAWYHYSAQDRPAFLASLDKAVAALWDTIDAALNALGADRGRVWLLGFSQGAYLAHVAALRRPVRVAGWIAQAGALRPDYVPGGLPALAGTPVLLQHGKRDPSTSPKRSAEAADLLRAAGAQVSLQLFDAGHVISPPMVEAVAGWLPPA